MSSERIGCHYCHPKLAAGGGFYFIARRGGKKEMRQQGDAALDEAIDETDLLEY